MPVAFRPFFDEWYPRLVRYLRARLDDPDHAEDIAQEAFVRLLDHEPRDPGAWLFTVAGHLAADHSRVARGRARHLELIRAESSHARAPSPEQALLRAEEADRLRRALGTLSERDRELLLLRHAGWRYRELAQQLGVTASSIGPLLARAERRLADVLRRAEDHDARRASH